MSDSELRRAHGTAGRQRVVSQFAQERIWSHIYSMYQRPPGPSTLKRAFDVVLAAVGLVIAAPLIAVAALLVRFLLGPPVFFRQTRPGLNGRPFTLYKLRTMRDVKNGDGTPVPDARRLTTFGRFLRATSLDELPELWNVLAGDMSLVGPRPLLLEYMTLYSDEQARRHEVRPGITGWAQVNGRNAQSWAERLALDVWYVDNRSLALDLRILARTVAVVFTRRGVSQPGHATMERFRGTAR
jgi:lipopolysaccharide/colanic/teichoic acid biosynthesis glycosyltransferase